MNKQGTNWSWNGWKLVNVHIGHLKWYSKMWIELLLTYSMIFKMSAQWKEFESQKVMWQCLSWWVAVLWWDLNGCRIYVICLLCCSGLGSSVCVILWWSSNEFFISMFGSKFSPLHCCHSPRYQEKRNMFSHKSRWSGTIAIFLLYLGAVVNVFHPSIAGVRVWLFPEGLLEHQHTAQWFLCLHLEHVDLYAWHWPLTLWIRLHLSQMFLSWRWSSLHLPGCGSLNILDQLLLDLVLTASMV